MDGGRRRAAGGYGRRSAYAFIGGDCQVRPGSRAGARRTEPKAESGGLSHQYVTAPARHAPRAETDRQHLPALRPDSRALLKTGDGFSV